jgi:hypothetical protein
MKRTTSRRRQLSRDDPRCLRVKKKVQSALNRSPQRLMNLLPAWAGRKQIFRLSLIATWPALAATTDLTALSLEQLLDVKIVGASKYEQEQGEVAAAMGGTELAAACQDSQAIEEPTAIAEFWFAECVFKYGVAQSKRGDLLLTRDET